jgi:Secretion system C-terminal sorting domain/Carbohydrate binding domain
MKRVMFFVLLTIVSHRLLSQNLVANPGFEKWDKLNKPAGWAVAQNCVKDSVYIRSGKYSCRHEGGTKYLGQTLPVNPDKKYRLSFFYKTTITGTGNGCRIWCYWKDTDGNNLTDANTDEILRPSKYLKSEIWQQFSADFSTPAGAVSFYLEVRTYSNSISYFDDFLFEENIATSAPEDELSEINIYPNPASDYLIINNISDFKYIDIQNLSGITIFSFACSGEKSVSIPVSDLPNGIYVIRLNGAGKIIARRFIKNN